MVVGWNAVSVIAGASARIPCSISIHDEPQKTYCPSEGSELQGNSNCPTCQSQGHPLLKEKEDETKGRDHGDP